MRAGSRWRSSTCTTEVIVVRAPESDGTLECGGSAMVEPSDRDAPCGHSDRDVVPLGKRYENAELGVEVLCTKAGCGPLGFAGEALTPKQAKPLPSSD
jgi:hypothetical protein